MKRRMLVAAFAVLYPLWLVISNSAETVREESAASTAANVTEAPNAPNADTHSLLAWSELGMHCDDGKDYSIFAILPPYNVVHAQVIKIGEPPVPITSGVSVTYQAMADAT